MTDDDRIAAWAALLRAHAAVLPKLERALAGSGLSLSWYDVLLVVNAAPERRMRMSEIGRQAVVSRERASRVVTELERAGLLERHANPDDKRSSFAAITPAGRALLRRVAPRYLAAVEEHFLAHLSDSGIRTVAKELTKVVAAEEA